MFGNYQGYGYQNSYNAPNYIQRGYAPQPSQMPQSQPTIQPQPQMPMSMPQQMPTTEMPIQDIKYVNRAQAEAYIVYPNTKVMLIDRDGGIAYLKSADSMGQLIQNDYFRFERVNADGTPIKPQEPTPQVNFDDFIKKEDLQKLGFVTISQYNELAQKLEQIQKQIMGGKQNVGQSKQPTEARM